jgi:c-di-GMP-binding flagellar brake protein YcgR
MGKNPFLNLVTTNCQTFKKDKNIREVLNNSLKSSSELHIRRFDPELNKIQATKDRLFNKDSGLEALDKQNDGKDLTVDSVRIAEVEKNFLIIEKPNASNINFKIRVGDSMEILIDEPSTSYYFTAEIQNKADTPKSYIIKLKTPTIITKITRRDFFRYEPPLAHPLRVKFDHRKLSLTANVHDISGGGLSIRTLPTDPIILTVGEEVTNIRILFIPRTIVVVRASILYAKKINFNGKEYSNFGLQFENFPSASEDALVKAIFYAHRESIKRDKLID